MILYDDNVMEEVVNNSALRLKRLNDLKKEAISNDSYIKGIVEELDDGKRIVNDLDMDNPSNLELLFRAIDDYAINNYYYSNVDDYESYYNIRFNNKLYKFGMIYGQGICFYLEKGNDKDNNYIEFSDVIGNKRPERANDIENKLSKIYFLIDTLYGSGIPTRSIKCMIDDYLFSIGVRDDKKKLR